MCLYCFLCHWTGNLRNILHFHWTHIITDRSSDEFSSMYVHLSANQDMISSTYHSGADEHLRLFNANCSNILNSIAPLKVKKQTKFSTLAK